MDKRKQIKNYLNLPYQKISNDIAIYLLVDVLHGNGIFYSDEELEKIVQAFCYNKVSKYYTNYKIIVLNEIELDEVTTLKKVSGLVKGNNVYLLRESVLALRDMKLDILRTIFHETHHIKQTYMLDCNEISYKVYLDIIEEVIKYKFGKEYYNNNYSVLFSEIDARFEEEFMLYNFLSMYANELLVNETEQILNNILNIEVDANNIYRNVRGIQFEREELFDQIIEENPFLIKEYPLLNLYYEIDGSKIPIGKIIKRNRINTTDPADIILCNKIRRLDELVIANRQGTRENLKRDIESLYEIDDGSEYIHNLILTLYNRSMDNRDNNLLDVYGIFTERLMFFKKKINKSRILANRYAAKIFMLINRV